jgi:N4-bis(aminopropyl)spermidine synthase
MKDDLDAVQQSLKEYWGLDFKRVCSVVQTLANAAFSSHGELVTLTALSHRSIDQIIEALAPFLEREDEGIRLATNVRQQAQVLFAASPPMVDPWGDMARQHPALPALTQDLSQRPQPDRHLDHVAATPITALKRALFLQHQYDLESATILLLGDHDMTAIALAHVQPDLKLAVADIDERLLAFIDDISQRRNYAIGTYFSDLRVDLPPSLHGQCDLVFTDPPYTATGIKLFLQRGISALKDRDFTRLVLSYGYGEQQTALGYKVQAVLHELRLVQEAILPHFNQYDNAPALGDCSDLYILRPTRRSLPAAQRIDRQVQIYTQGRLSEESQHSEIPLPLLKRITTFASERRDSRPLLVGEPLPKEQVPSSARMELGPYLQGLREGEKKTQQRRAIIANLYPHYTAYILRICLSSRADELLICAGARALSDLFAHPSVLRSLVESRYELVERIQEGNAAITLLKRSSLSSGDDATRVLSRIAERPQARLANAWREALINWALIKGIKLSKNEARTIIQTRPLGRAHGQSYLGEIPLYALGQLNEDIAATIAAIDITTERNEQDG